MALTELKIKSLKPRKARYFVSDGKGLCLAVMPSGEKYWHIRIREGGRDRKRTLGRYPDISLREARELRWTVRHQGGDMPAILSKIAKDWIAKRCAMLSTKTLTDIRSHLDRFILPLFGGRDIKSIKPVELFEAVSKIQREHGASTGWRVKGILSRIFRFAIAAGLAEWDAAAQIAGALAPMPKPQHYSTVGTADGARHVLQAIDRWEGRPIVRLGLLMLAYTFVRPGELRLARWGEIDLGAATWRIPAERTKMRREHVVPLSAQAAEMFRQLRELTRHPVHCFVTLGNDVPMSATVFHAALREMGFGKGKMTPHGFRGMASTLLNEHGFRPDAIERQLAHVEPNAVRAAYDRAAHMEERRKMMQWWGDFLDGLRR